MKKGLGPPERFADRRMQELCSKPGFRAVEVKAGLAHCGGWMASLGKAGRRPRSICSPMVAPAIFSVSDLNARARLLLEESLGWVWIRRERLGDGRGSDAIGEGALFAG